MNSETLSSRNNEGQDQATVHQHVESQNVQEGLYQSPQLINQGLTENRWLIPDPP